jgi:hypothetical protein
MHIKDGKKYNVEARVTVDGVRYHNAKDASIQEKLGITEVADPLRKNDQFYYVTEQDDAPWVVNTPKSKDQLTSMLWGKIKSLRDNKIISGGAKVEVAPGEFKWFHSDTHSKLQQAELRNLGAALPANVNWKTMDGSFIVLTPELVVAITTAQLIQEMSIFAHAEALKSAIGALAEPVDNADEFEAFDVNAGWPETYEGA